MLIANPKEEDDDGEILAGYGQWGPELFFTFFLKAHSLVTRKQRRTVLIFFDIAQLPLRAK